MKRTSVGGPSSSDASAAPSPAAPSPASAQGQAAQGQAAQGQSTVTSPGVAWWRRGVWPLAALGGLLLWAAQPPLGWWPLAPLAPIPWLLLVRWRQLPGRRPYLWIYLAGTLHWALLLQGLRHPHWALYIGWWVLACYLGLYLPLFIATTRALVWRLGWPLLLAAPVVWTALELLRAHLLTGLSLASLGHALADVPLLIQTADLGGAYLVGALLMAVAAALSQTVALSQTAGALSQSVAGSPDTGSPEGRGAQREFRSLAVAAALVAAACGYGAWRLGQPGPEPTLEIAVLQGARDVFYEYDPKANQEMYVSYRHWSREACRQHPQVGLVVWPESSLAANFPEVIVEGPLTAPPDEELDDQLYQQAVEEGVREFHARLAALAYDVSPRREVDLIVSTETIHAAGEQLRRYNSTLLVRDDGRLERRYYKMHPVMFGEYLPFGRWLPWLYEITPMPAGLTPGEQPVAMQCGGLQLSPSICFETTVPHLIRQQVARLRRAGKMPDVLINPANDGWFHGSSILDLHAQCVVFRAVENGRPVLSSVNGGLSSWVDERGRVRRRLPRKQEAYLIARCGPGRGVTIYQRMGDWFAWSCAGLTLLALASLGREARRFRREAAKFA